MFASVIVGAIRKEAESSAGLKRACILRKTRNCAWWGRRPEQDAKLLVVERCCVCRRRECLRAISLARRCQQPPRQVAGYKYPSPRQVLACDVARPSKGSGPCSSPTTTTRTRAIRNTVLWGDLCLGLKPARAFAFGQGVRAPTSGGVRPWCRLPERVVREWNPHST